jgi:Uma2 family endonuclease
MAENTVQYEWIVTLKENLEAALPDAFVAADLFWYPVEGDNRTRRAPDVMVALGRPKGHRMSYLQWEEAGVAPQVVFEIWSPGNSFPAMVDKLKWYDRFGVEEFYTYDPDRNEFAAFLRAPGGSLDAVPTSDGHRSPRLGVRFQPGERTLAVFGPDGRPFLTVAQLRQARREAEARAEQEAARAEQEAARAEQEAARADQEAARADQEAARADALAARLRALGLDPDAR